jgi:two-component system, LytTR family, response regulator
MRALIVDDERRARSELKRLLRAHPEIEVVGESANAEEALSAIEKLSPDLLFLDVQMPGKSGFDLLAEIENLPRVIFTTAFDEYALRAFEFHAFDYLLKPIEPKRLAESLAQLTANAPTVSADSQFPQRPFDPNDQVFVKENERCWLVRIGEISVLESDGNYTRVFFGASRPLIYRSLNSLEARLDPRHFFRASRKHILNLAKVERIEPWFSSGLMVHLEGGHKIEMSRRQGQRFRELRSL